MHYKHLQLLNQVYLSIILQNLPNKKVLIFELMSSNQKVSLEEYY